MIRFPATDREDTPTPHIVHTQVFEPAFFKSLEEAFPKDSDFAHPAPGEWYRMSRDLVRGDTAYQTLMERSSAWRSLYEHIHSPAFVSEMLELFKDAPERYGSRVHSNVARFVDYHESRDWMSTTDVAAAVRASDANPNELFTRLDFGLGDRGYTKDIHTDWPHRLFSILIYFSDADEDQMEGGSLMLYAMRRGSAVPMRTIRPKKNTGIIMLDTPHSYHGVDTLVSSKHPRRSLYIAVSSRTDIWHGSRMRSLLYRVAPRFS